MDHMMASRPAERNFASAQRARILVDSIEEMLTDTARQLASEPITYNPFDDGRLVDMWPRPDMSADQKRKREAVQAVLRRNRMRDMPTDVLDDLIAAAETGI